MGMPSTTASAAGTPAACGDRSGHVSRRQAVRRPPLSASNGEQRGWGPHHNGGQAAQALGRSRGGCSTTIHAGGLAEQTSAALERTSGARHEAPVLEAVVAQRPAMPPLTSAVMDHGYDRDQSRQDLQSRELWPVIPPKCRRKKPISYDIEPYQ